MTLFEGPSDIQWSALAYDVDSGERLFEHDSEQSLNTASIGKIFLLHTLLQEVDNGTRKLEDRVTRQPAEWMDNSGIWYLLQADELSLYDVAAFIGAVSDNAATNTMCRVVGLDKVAAHTAELGYQHSGLDDIVRWPMPPGKPKKLSHGSAAELSDFCARLSRDEDLSVASCDILKRWLGAGMDLSMVASAFNLDPLAHYFFDRDVWLWNKTGTISTARADIGVVMSPTRRVAYAVLANWSRDTDRRDDVMATMRAAGERIRSFLAG